MAGYAGYSMSNNAVDAYDRGLAPLSKVARPKGVTTTAVAAFVPAAEWHHTSKRYNKTKFYCPNAIRVAYDASTEAVEDCEACGDDHTNASYAVRVAQHIAAGLPMHTLDRLDRDELPSDRDYWTRVAAWMETS